MSKASEKRKHPRVAAKAVAAHVNFADRSTPCAIVNISAGGMLVESAEPLPAGIPVAVNLAQPGWTKVLRLPGRVVWALAPKAAAKKGKAPGMRIRFDPLEPDAAEMLLEMLHELGIGETPPPDRAAVPDTLPPFSALPQTGRAMSKPEAVPVRAPSRHEMPAPRTSAPREMPAPRTSAPPQMPVGAPTTRTIRGSSQVDATTSPAMIPLGAPNTQTLPGARTQELSLKDIVAHISQVEVPAVVITHGKQRTDATILVTPSGSPDVQRLIAQVKTLTLQLDSLQRDLEDRDRELTQTREALHAKQLALEKADRERKAAETAIQRLSMQIAARR